MDNKYISTGEFAKLAGTTKRTITWYDEMGILKPFKIDPKGYRFYLPEQILDFQAILLLRKLNFSIETIKNFLAKGENVRDLFNAKRAELSKEIESLQQALDIIDKYYTNLDSNGTFVSPVVKEVHKFEIYYIEKTGSYSKIKEYGEELYSYLNCSIKRPVFLTLFLEEGYRPSMSKMKIAIIAQEGIIIKKGFENIVKKDFVPSYKALSYVHKGTGNLLSLLWKEVEKYADKNGYEYNEKLPFTDIEFYYNALTEDNISFEINLPIL